MLFQPVGIYLKKYEWSGSQEGGDCSLWVRAATLEFDDGEWECQVTASDFTTQDALTSAPVRLVVRGKSLSHVKSCKCKRVEHVIKTRFTSILKMTKIEVVWGVHSLHLPLGM